MLWIRLSVRCDNGGVITGVKFIEKNSIVQLEEKMDTLPEGYGVMKEDTEGDFVRREAGKEEDESKKNRNSVREDCSRLYQKTGNPYFRNELSDFSGRSRYHW